MGSPYSRVTTSTKAVRVGVAPSAAPRAVVASRPLGFTLASMKRPLPLEPMERSRLLSPLNGPAILGGRFGTSRVGGVASGNRRSPSVRYMACEVVVISANS